VIDKIDLLFMIDNSRSMGDKQTLLAKAVPKLVDRLVVPRCVSEAGSAHQRLSVNEACPAGSSPEFRAVSDIHVAIITSSLGDHGATNGSCGDAAPGNDRAWLMPTVRPNLASYNQSGFLAWDPLQKLSPTGERDAARLGQHFGAMVEAASELGCGYEASLEAWYRFLVDPEPPLEVVVDPVNNNSVARGLDTTLLAQRSAFLRPDSLVAIVMLTDENDCSVRDDGAGYLVGNGEKPMPRASSACAVDPNHPCCSDCTGFRPVAPGCPSLDSDPACLGGGDHLAEAEDHPNLRCATHKRRFGFDFLYPTSRYVEALTSAKVPRRSDGALVDNPLFRAPPGKSPRLKENVYLAGIVGVPWQDVADDASQKGPGLRYLAPKELSASGRWDVMLGDPQKNVAPSDPFMHESSAPRSGQNPVTGDPIVAETSLDPRASPINGHEQVDLDQSDLQYACTFALPEPEPCSGETCDCNGPATGNDLPRNRPLCQPPAGGQPESTQYFGKAYPGLRALEVLKGIGDSAIVASICPKVLTVGQPGYGYEPAVDAIIERLKVGLNGNCLPRPLAVEAEANGKLPCTVVEASDTEASCTCDAAQRKPASAAARPLVERELQSRQLCGTASTRSCSSFCLCELDQAAGQALEECLNSEGDSATPGYCYLDPFGTPPIGNPALVEGCTQDKRLLRFVGPDTPTPGAYAFIACLGATLH